MLCVIVLQLHLCMLTKLAPESYLQKYKDCPCYSSWESGNDNFYGGKSPLHGIDFFICPTACHHWAGFSQGRTARSCAGSPHGRGSRPPEEGQAAGRALAPAAAPLPAPWRVGGTRVTHSSLSLRLWSWGRKRLQKDESRSHEGGNGSINDWWNISIYWFKSILFFCLAFVF